MWKRSGKPERLYCHDAGERAVKLVAGWAQPGVILGLDRYPLSKECDLQGQRVQVDRSRRNQLPKTGK
jgi:hypothetical protein